MAGKKTMKLASRGKRFWAACIDLGILAALYILLMIAISAISPRRYISYGYGYGFEDGYGFGYDYGYHQPPNTAAIVAAVVIGLMILAYVVLEFIFYAQSKSIGKVILGMQVVSGSDGRPLGFWKMLFREAIVKQASGVFLLGYIWILIDEKNRAWHDKILETYVVDLKETGKLGAGGQAGNVNAPSSAAAAVSGPSSPPADPAQAVRSAPAVTASHEAPPADMAETAPSVSTEVEPSGEAAPADGTGAGPAKTEAPAMTKGAAIPKAPAMTKGAAIPKTPVIRLDSDYEPAPEPDDVRGPEAGQEPASEPAEIRTDMSMKKAELMEIAQGLGISIGSKATKADIIEAIRKASEQ